MNGVYNLKDEISWRNDNKHNLFKLIINSKNIVTLFWIFALSYIQMWTLVLHLVKIASTNAF